MLVMKKSDQHRSQYRLPDELYERLRKAAEDNGRSLNSEVVARLEFSFQPTIVEQMAPLLEAMTARIVDEINKRGGA